MTAIFIAAISPLLIIDKNYLLISGIIATIFTYFAISKNLLPSIHHSSRKSWGIFFFPLAYTIGIIICPPADYWIFCISFVILAISDSLAAITGELFAERYFRLTSDKKSFLGSIVFFLVTLIILLFFLSHESIIPFDKSWPKFELNLTFLAGIICLSIFLTLIEAISSKGFDNFLIPFFTFLLITLLFKNFNFQLIHNFAIAMLLASLIVISSMKMEFLTPNGGVSVFILATIIFGFGSWKWTIPILTFFVLSSLLSKYRTNINEEIDNYFEKSGKRDMVQVAANGMFGAVLLILNRFDPHPIYYTAFVASIAAVCADTWSTEFGTIKNNKTYNILSLKPVVQGSSGGISLPGTLGGILGALIISISGVFWIKTDYFSFVLIIIFAGIAGSTIDSILGATVQSQYKCDICKKVTENKIHCFQKSKIFKGVSWVNNDLVNFLTSLSGGLTAFIIFKLFR